MAIKEIVKKLGELLHNDKNVYNGNVCFDFSSYDFEEDIPHISIFGKRTLIENIFISKDGDYITLTNGNGQELNLYMEKYTEKELEEMNLYELLNTTYYETTYSYEIGDFELDFLNI
jgi:hypothetical protein